MIVRVRHLIANRKLYKRFRHHTWRATWYFIRGNEELFAYHITRANEIHELLQENTETDK